MESESEDRFAALELQLRRWRWVAVGAVVLSGVALFAALGWRSMRVRELSIVDERGAVVATLAAEGGEPLLRMRSAKAESEMLVGAMVSDMGIAIIGKRSQVHLATGSEGFPAMSMWDQSKSRLLLGLSPGDGQAPFLQVRDESGRVRVYGDLVKDPRLVVMDGRGGATPLSLPPPRTDSK